MLIANQAIGLTQAALQAPKLGAGTQVAFEWLQKRLPTSMGDDRYMHDDIAESRQWLDSYELMRAVVQTISC